jgi:hypothetical protein
VGLNGDVLDPGLTVTEPSRTCARISRRMSGAAGLSAVIAASTPSSSARLGYARERLASLAEPARLGQQLEYLFQLVEVVLQAGARPREVVEVSEDRDEDRDEVLGRLRPLADASARSRFFRAQYPRWEDSLALRERRDPNTSSSPAAGVTASGSGTLPRPDLRDLEQRPSAWR